VSDLNPPPDSAPESNDVTTGLSPRRGKGLLREIVETALLTLIIYGAVNFATGRFRIESISMEPNLHPGQYVIVDKLSYVLGQPQRGDVVVFQYPLAPQKDYIKRVIGLPGETVVIGGGAVGINGQPLSEPYIAAPPNLGGTWALGPDQFFVMGDNRNNSSDSRSWGPLEGKYLIGKAVLVYWPPPSWGWVSHPTYASSGLPYP
jgi:signal peptidase I